MSFLIRIRQYERLFRLTGQAGHEIVFQKTCGGGIIARYSSKSLRETFDLKNLKNSKRVLVHDVDETQGDRSEQWSLRSLILLIIPVTSGFLGTWQVFRWREKLRMIDDLETQTNAPPVPFPKDLSEFESLEYRKVKVRGRFDYSKEALIGPRSLKRDSVPMKGIIKQVRNNAGYQIITPFKVSGQNLIILVNRGWIPSFRETNYRSIPESDEVEIVGIVRKNEKRPTFMNKHSGRVGLYLYRNLPAMAKTLGTDNIFLDLSSVEAVDLTQSFPIPAQTRVTLHNDHVSYIFTWYGLAIATAFLWHKRFSF